MRRLTVWSLALVACSPAPAAPEVVEPAPAHTSASVEGTRTPPVPVYTASPASPVSPQPQGRSAEELAALVAPQCAWAHTTASARVRAAACLGGDVVELPLVTVHEVGEPACLEPPCESDLTPRQPDLACWADARREDRVASRSGGFSCLCAHLGRIGGEPFLFCRRQWLDRHVRTAVVLYRRRAHEWSLALERTVLAYDLDAGDAVDLHAWLAADKLWLLGAKCQRAHPEGSASAEVCGHAGAYELRDEGLVQVAPQPPCIAGLLPPPPAPRRRARAPEADLPWFYSPIPPPLPLSTGLLRPCPHDP